MIERTLAKRYAGALVEIAKEPVRLESLRTELVVAGDIFKTNPPLRSFLANPFISLTRKQELIKGAFQKALSRELIEFIELLVEKRRITIFAEIVQVYQQLADERLGLVLAEVSSYRPLQDDQKKRLVENLSKLTGKKVIIKEQFDPNTLGGIRVRIGDTVLDGSVSGRLRKMMDTLLRKA